ncbi:hypothetical protein WG66_014991 [Moniliophthora roreri]|nr:hypothetical protein WG66_014991 [Moniliophthora roreri]
MTFSAQRLNMISRALGLFIFCSFAAALSFILVSASSPGWESISFLNVGSEGSERHFGVFGYTGSKAKMGYKFPDLIPEPKTLNGFTRTLVAHPIGAAHSAIDLSFGLYYAVRHRNTSPDRKVILLKGAQPSPSLSQSPASAPTLPSFPMPETAIVIRV